MKWIEWQNNFLQTIEQVENDKNIDKTKKAKDKFSEFNSRISKRTEFGAYFLLQILQIWLQL